MRFLHLGDLHLGRSLNDFDLLEDQRYILDRILEIISRYEADSVLISGDVYDKSIPSEAATRLLDAFLCSLAERGIKTFMISGNHDSDDRLNFGSRLFRENQIYIAAKFSGELCRYTLEDAYGEVDIYMLPYVRASQVKRFYPEAEIDSYDAAVKEVLRHADIDPDRRNVILAHQFVTGGTDDPVLSGSENVGVQSVGTIEKISAGVFDAFDYAALGHIHSPQQVGRPGIRYAGSPLKYSLSEAHSEKSVPVVTLKEKGQLEIELVPLNPLRELRHIRGTLEELLAMAKTASTEDYLYVTLTDEDIIDNALGVLRQVYPRVLKLDYDNSRMQEALQVDITGVTGRQDLRTLVSDFYRTVYGVEISEEEFLYLKTAAQEAGITYETD